MCGIVGILSYKQVIRETMLVAMNRRLSHRGPDDEGIYVNSPKAEVGSSNLTQGTKKKSKENNPPFVGLGHRRLSIIDLSTGHQPIQNEDGSIWLVYNGETYNFEAQKKDLIKKNHRFRTDTDTEVIVHLYEEYGERCVDYLRGMFAFALWDKKRKKLFIARDRLGKKPLYFHWDGATFLFASEAKALFACSGIKKELDLEGFTNYLKYGYVPAPGSIYKGIRKLPAGHQLVIENEKLTTRDYWDIDLSPSHPGNEETIEKGFLDKLTESVKLRLMSDVPLGAFLSGGIDSGMIVALMAQNMDRPVKTFSIGFPEPEYNELGHARLVADRYKTEHHEMMVYPESFDLIEEMIEQFDEPFGDASLIPTYYVSRFASQHVKVVLSGDGGDEFFAGYDSYAAVMHRSKYERFPAAIRQSMRFFSEQLPKSFYGKNFLHNISLPSDQRFTDYVTHLSPRYHADLLSGDVRAGSTLAPAFLEEFFTKAKKYDAISRMQYVDIKSYLPENILVKVDRMSMAHSLEVRAPLLDHETVEYANAIPSRFKLHGTTRKYLLKNIARRLLPREILEKKKQGFSVPLKYWFKGEL
ncbi:MAG: asparagine synthase (glutamine-hydrolyzing), partial [Nitrospinota bacterium]